MIRDSPCEIIDYTAEEDQSREISNTTAAE